MKNRNFRARILIGLVAIATGLGGIQGVFAAWQVGTPITSYWGQPSAIPSTIQWSADGGYNLIWGSTAASIDWAAAQPGMRALYMGAPFTTYQAGDLSDPTKKAAIDHTIDVFNSTKVVNGKTVPVYPAFYGYYLTDEPLTGFSAWGELVDYLHQRDPNHVAFINLSGIDSTYSNATFPTTASYNSFLDQYVGTVHPSLLSYDQYQMMQPNNGGDLNTYLLNLQLISQKAKSAGVPFINTVQATRWNAAWRAPNSYELRYLAYSSMAYGAQGLSWFNYYTNGYPSTPDYALKPNPDGSPSAIQTAVTPLNNAFVKIASQYQKLNWIGTYLKGYKTTALPPGTSVMPTDGSQAFDIYSLGNSLTYHNGDAIKGALFGLFDWDGAQQGDATFALVVNNDYTSSHSWRINGPGADLSTFSAATGLWTSLGLNYADVTLGPGEGVLIGLSSKIHKSGDFNLDGKIDASDLSTMMAALADTNSYRTANDFSAPEFNAIGDVNGDGSVTNADLQQLITLLKAGGGGVYAVPEPSSLLISSMLFVGTFAVFRPRMQKRS